MAKTTRQTAIFGVEDWKTLYKTFNHVDLQSYNFETIRKTFVDYIRQYHPETFNDFTENSEFIVLLDLIAFMGQALSFRNDLNTRENFLDTAERRDSVTNLAKLVGYTPKRNEAATGFLKVLAVSTTENIVDYNKNNLSNIQIRWNDKTNDDWQEQWTMVLNAALVDSQKIGQPGRSATIVGIKTDEYQLNMAPGFLPVIPFTSTVNGTSTDFEVVNGTSIGKTYIYEPAPKLNGPLNILYRNDNQGYASANTGYFFYFKQGILQSDDFSFVDRIANRSYDINYTGINNDDFWLFKIDSNTGLTSTEWTYVDSIYTTNTSQVNSTSRPFFTVTSRAEDKITLNFGDGVFSDIPVGQYRAYVRQSNGLEYIINPEEIQNINVSFSYTSKIGRLETLTLTVGLTQPVTNAQGRELISDIKRRAPARYYTQNRMVNGEDYNNFPYASYGSIIKSKAINRTNIGASRYLDLVDPTGKYSSINTYASDGLLYKDSTTTSFNFTFTDTNDISQVIQNKVEPLLAKRETVQYYYANFARVDLSATDIIWNQSTTITNKTSGYFVDSLGNILKLGSYVNDNKEYIVNNALIKFLPPTGYHFSSTNKVVAGTTLSPGDKDYIWATILDVINDGTNQGLGNFADGSGPVTINNFVPTGSIPTEIIPLFNSSISSTIKTLMLTQIQFYRNFGLGFDYLRNSWYLISSDNLNQTSAFSLINAQDTSNTNLDSSWLIMFISGPNGYTVTSRGLHYYFSSIIETRFFYDESQQIYDPKTGKIVNDFVKVLKTNSMPNTNIPLTGDVLMDIIGQNVEVDGYVNDYKVEVSYTDRDNDGIADDPDYFTQVVGTNSNNRVYLQSIIDYDNLERYVPITSSSMNADYATIADIEKVKTENTNGQLFYATVDNKFYELVVDNSNRYLTQRNDFVAKAGRDGLYFQYRHNSPETRRINPSVTNIIDIYVAVASYYDSYIKYVQDNTNTVLEPAIPTTEELTTEYESLQNYKMVSDTMILNSVRFKPLFGSKAAANLQAYIKVVKLNNITTSDSEIKSRIVSAINQYFDIQNWDFGDTFYFSELSAYLHTQVGDVIGSVVITPKDPTKKFGDLYEIKSAPYEIFVSAATVDDIQVINSLTASTLQN